MKKIIFFVGLLLVANYSFAGICANGSLTGAYNFNLTDVDSGQSNHSVGRINFNGKGSATISGVSSESGVAKVRSGSGTYSVSSTCLATGTFSLSNGTKVTYWLYLDNMDSTPRTSIAYHGNIVYKSIGGGETGSGSGSLDRVIGKF